MPRKPKFKPVITRVKLNPEQAVLSCKCWNNSTYYLGPIGPAMHGVHNVAFNVCGPAARTHYATNMHNPAGVLVATIEWENGGTIS